MFTRRETVHPIYAERVWDLAGSVTEPPRLSRGHNLPSFPPSARLKPRRHSWRSSQVFGIKCLSGPAAEVAEVSRRWQGAIGWSLINNKQALLKPISLQCWRIIYNQRTAAKMQSGLWCKAFLQMGEKLLLQSKQGVQVSLWLRGQTSEISGFCFISAF